MYQVLQIMSIAILILTIAGAVLLIVRLVCLMEKYKKFKSDVDNNQEKGGGASG